MHRYICSYDTALNVVLLVQRYCTHMPVHKPEYSTIRYNTIRYNTIQYNTIQYNAMQCNAIQYNAIQCSTMQYNTVQYNTIQYNTLQYNTIQYNTIQYNTIQYNTIQYMLEEPPSRLGYRSLRLRVALACEPRALIPYSLVSHPSYPLGD
jgi:hypothetical protein